MTEELQRNVRFIYSHKLNTAACMKWEGEKGREMAEVRWRSYFLSVGVILPLTAVLSAAWMEVDPVS